MECVAGLSALLRHGRLSLALALVGPLLWVSASAAQSASTTSTTVGSPGSPGCNASADSVAGAARSGELITVVAATTASQHATVELFRREDGCFMAAAGPYSAWVGRNGLSTHHSEGDGTTPLGLYGIEATMYGAQANPGVLYPYHRLVCGDWWDEQSGTPDYNRFVHVPCGERPTFAGESEALWRELPSYDYFVVIAYNSSPVVPGRGSAIFLHVSDGKPTAGCVSISEVDLVRVLRDLRPTLDPLVFISAG